ncbi:MAG: hypothetical protein IT462_02895 [Planctomycetes bacterium]|nr:hypothetical protein [Planctomycetota bacterium]
MRTRLFAILPALLLLVASAVPAAAALDDAKMKTVKGEYEKTLKQGQSTDDFQLRIRAYKMLEGADHEDAAKLLIAALKDEKHATCLRTICETCASFRAEGVVKLFVAEAAPKGKSPLDNRCKLLRTLPLTQTKVAYDGVLAILDDKKSDLQFEVAGLDALALFGSAAAPSKDRAVVRLKHSFRSVRIAACNALGAICEGSKDEATATALIDLLEKGDGNDVDYARQALMKITGVDCGLDVREWRNWLFNQKFPNAKEDDPNRPGATSVKKPRKTTDYFGNEITAQRMVFVIDCSKSMLEPVSGKDRLQNVITEERKKVKKPVITGSDTGETPEEKKPEEEAPAGPPKDERKNPGGEGKRPLNWSAIKIKWDLASQELINTLESLPDDREFTIVFFSTNVWVWKPVLVKSTPDNIKDAVLAIRRIKPDGNTNIFGALMKAFSLTTDPKLSEKLNGKAGPKGPVTGEKPAPEVEKEAIEKGAESIYFLTDGAPTDGLITDSENIRAFIEDYNSSRKVQINTFYIGDPGQGNHHGTSLMASLAHDSGGVYVDLAQEGNGR